MQLYATVGSNRLDDALPFYDALLGLMGWHRLFPNPAGGCFWGKVEGADFAGLFAVVTPFDEDKATVGNGTMIGFALGSNREVDSFYAKALELGGSDEGAPGFRGPEEVGAYFAYFRDLDGNKLCAYHWKPQPA